MDNAIQGRKDLESRSCKPVGSRCGKTGLYGFRTGLKQTDPYNSANVVILHIFYNIKHMYNSTNRLLYERYLMNTLLGMVCF